MHSSCFLSLFREINGTTYIGIAKDKESAAEEFERRKDDGENAGLVESRYCSAVARNCKGAVLRYVDTNQLHTDLWRHPAKLIFKKFLKIYIYFLFHNCIG